MARYAPGRSRRFRAWYVQKKRRDRKKANQSPPSQTADFNSDDFDVNDWRTV